MDIAFSNRIIPLFAFVAVLLIHFEVSAQKTRTIKHELKGPSKYQSYVESYQVLRENASTMHGRYELFDHKNRLTASGYYKFGKKDSMWIEYDVWKHFLSAKGNFSNGKKTGVWTYYKNADTVEFTYDFDRDSVIYFFKSDTAKMYSVLTDKDTIETKLDREPLYLGGRSYLGKVISDNIFYPDEAKESNVQGRVLVAFTIYPDGHSSAPWVFKSIHSSLDKAAIEILSKVPPNWLPGILDGKSVTSLYIVPITFTLQ